MSTFPLPDRIQHGVFPSGLPEGLEPQPSPTSPSMGINVPPDSGGGGIDWMQLIKLVAPAVGQFARGSKDGGAFMRAFMDGQPMADHEKAQHAADAQRRQTAGADFLMKVGERASAIDDPIAFAHFLDLAEDAGIKAGYTKPGEIKGRLQFDPARQNVQRLKELDDLLAGLEKGGYDIDALRESGASVQMKDGTRVPLAVAMELRGTRPVNAAGQPIARPKKAATGGTVAERVGTLRTQIRQAMEAGDGKEADRLQAEMNDILEGERAISTASRKPTDPDIEALQKDLLGLRTDAARAALNKPDKPDVSPAQSFQMEERLARAWNDANKASKEMTRQYGLMQTGLQRFRQGDKNGGSQAVLVTFQKILDPTSVVRESEYARTATGQSLLNRIEGYIEKLDKGGAGMLDSELASMVETAKQMLGDMQGFNAGTRRRIEEQVKSRKLNPAAVFDDVLMGNDAPAATAAPSGPNVGDVVTVKGRRVKVTKVLPDGKYEGVPVP